MFGGLAVCSVEAVVDKDDKEYIIEVNDSALGLMGDNNSQEEDKKMIAEMVLREMEAREMIIFRINVNHMIRWLILPRKIVKIMR